MCGIAGVIGLDSKTESSPVLGRILGAIHHRGPDEEGTLIAPRLAAGTRRLSIIDLAGGSQPIWNETRSLAVCFNGEIYNFQSLREELIAAGHKFQTRSDTEVIVHAYEQWGTDGFARLHGMFAFVLAEMPEGATGPVSRVTIARDPLGIKPLYYAAASGAFLFASEVRSLIASRLLAPQISADAIGSYLLFGSVCEPNTVLEGVFSLPPGHFIQLAPSAAQFNPQPKPFWSLGAFGSYPSQSSASSASYASSAAPTRVLSYLSQAVQSHLIADVPVGIFLSSGLDSTAIASLAARAHPGIHTFTVAFPDLEFSEAAEARRTAERLGTQHCELQLSGDEMLARLDEAISAFDQPSMDGINTYFVSWAARQSGLKVALSGLGSDELFGGYPTFRTTESVARLTNLAHSVPAPLRRLIGSFRRAGNHSPSREKAVAAWLTPEAFPHSYFFTRALFTPQQLANVVHQGAASAVPSALPIDRGSTSVKDVARNGSASDRQERQKESPSAGYGTLWRQNLANYASQARQMDAFNAVSWLELRTYMLNTLLRDTDSMSMANSLEVRVPFLDTPLVEFVLSLPESEKRADRPKSLLINALADLFPENIKNQVGRRKRTFTFPWEKWLRGPLRAKVTASLSDWSPALASAIPGDFAQRVWADFLESRTTWSRPWSLFVLNEWSKRHLAGAEHASFSLQANSNARSISS
jgi:asparagine synthase (glutamine-hydrolysing)